ncbi:protein FAM200A-like [Diorhabda carinulata]|uniref:protein FAM200A-like n=1 Tax=Diorhabda carinulata TaxID=1163345 RepID=UPI0025A1032F|nr:protein FAM200A-like [Diorhabda carinulata]
MLPAAIKMVEMLHGRKYGNDIRKIPLSNDTVSNRISDVNNDQLVQLIIRIKESPKFSIHLDETTDITKLAQLLVYVRCTDGARAMTGKNIGFKSIFQAAHHDHITFTHCLILREVLAAKKSPPELNDVLQDAVKIINFIKSRAVNTRLFSNLCKDTDSNYTTFLSHAEVRWLSRSQSLRRLLLLKDEIEIFLTERKCARDCSLKTRPIVEIPIRILTLLFNLERIKIENTDGYRYCEEELGLPEQIMSASTEIAGTHARVSGLIKVVTG